MTFFRSVLNAPQPLRTLMLAYIGSFVVILVGFAFGRPEAGFSVLGVAAIALGGALASNLRGSAQAYAEMMRSFRPMGVDYTRSMYSNPRIVRFIGAMMVVVGVAFLVLIATDA